MNLRVVGCSFRTAPVALREKLAFDPVELEKCCRELAQSLRAEVVVLSTCNRVEIAVARRPGEMPWGAHDAAAYLGKLRGVPREQLAPALTERADAQAVRHLFRVASSLDSLVVGEGQIAGQVKQAFELAQRLGTTGPLTHALFPAALRVAKRVRSETGITKGHVSISSVAVDYVRQVFDHFADKTVLVIGAGKMGRLTLKHLQALKPGAILVANRSPEKAAQIAGECGGKAVPFEQLDEALVKADIVLSTTGAAEPIMTAARYRKLVRPRRREPQVILDISVPRDFEAELHDGNRVYLFNIDDLTRIREHALGERRQHIAPAELIVDAEVRKFADDWNRRRHGTVIGQLTGEVDALRAEVVGRLLPKLDGLSDEHRKQIEVAFKQFQNKLLHGPIAALQEASRGDFAEGGTLLESLKKLFRLE